MRSQLLFLAVLLIFFSCKPSDTTCNLDEERLKGQVALDVHRLEQEFFAAKTVDELRFLLEKYPEIADKVMEKETYPTADSLAQELLRANQDSAFQALNAAVAKEF